MITYISRFDHIKAIINSVQKHNPEYFHETIKTQLFNWLLPKINEISDELLVQHAGTNKSIEFIEKYKNHKFRIHMEKDIDRLIINILTFSTNPQYCSSIIVDKKQKIAILQNLSYYKECTSPDFIQNKGGSFILNFVLNFIRINRGRFGISRIVLKDTSRKYCKHCKTNVVLPSMYFLLYGDTWYGKYGFRP